MFSMLIIISFINVGLALLAQPLPPLPAETIGFNIDGSPSEALQLDLLDYGEEGSGNPLMQHIINKDKEEKIKDIILKSSKFKDISSIHEESKEIDTTTEGPQLSTVAENPISTAVTPSPEFPTVTQKVETTPQETTTSELNEEDFATVTIPLPDEPSSMAATTERPPIAEAEVNIIETTQRVNTAEVPIIGKEGKEIAFSLDKTDDRSLPSEDISKNNIKEIELTQLEVPKRGSIARRRLRIKQQRIEEEKTHKKIMGDSKEIINDNKSNENATPTVRPTTSTMISSVRTTIIETSSQIISTTHIPRGGRVESEVAASPLVKEEQRNEEDLAKAEHELKEIQELRRNHLQGLTKRRRLRHKGEHGRKRTNNRRTLKIKVVAAVEKTNINIMNKGDNGNNRIVDAHVTRIAVTDLPTSLSSTTVKAPTRRHRKHRRGVSKSKNNITVL